LQLLSEFQFLSIVGVILKKSTTELNSPGNRQISDTKKKQWKDTDETMYYVSTILLSAGEFCKAVRNHWGIENRNHYVRDVTMNEDKSRIRNNSDIFARLKSFALNILRVNKVKNIADELYYNCINIVNIFNYKGIEEN
jgi:predicted transposase YbfD/YdcC